MPTRDRRRARAVRYHRLMVVDDDVAAAVAALRAGQVIGLPTETVYGLAADASNPDAVARIFAIKGRPASHPVIVHIADPEQVAVWARMFPERARALARVFWPGPLTLVLPRADAVLLQVTGGQDTVALRVPAHPLALAVLRAFGGGVAAPSANRYGRISPTTAAHVREDLGDAVAMVLDGGPCQVGLESTIVACLDDTVKVLRPGRITTAEIEAVAGPSSAADAAAPRVPGSVVSHYAPRTPLTLVPAADIRRLAQEARRSGARIAVLASAPAVDDVAVAWIDAGDDPVQYGRNLYAYLRDLDRVGASRIVIAEPPDDPAWHAIRDRLTRAAARHG